MPARLLPLTVSVALLLAPSLPASESGPRYRIAGTFAEGLAVNERGQVVGDSLTADRSGMPHAMLWKDGVMTDLGLLPGGGYSQAKQRAVIFRDGAWVDLNGLIPPGTGWLLRGATHVNRRGQICGFGRVNGARAAFVLTPE